MRNAMLVVLFALSAGEMALAQTDTAAKREGVGRLLKEMGHEPNALSPDVYQISIDREGWKVHIMISLTREADRIWLESRFAPIDRPDLVPAAAWRTLLEENERIGPAHFTFDKSDKRVHLYKAFDLDGLTVSRLKSELDHFDATVRRTQTLWRGENFAVSESIPVSPRVVGIPADETDFLKGNWRIVRIEAKGESITEERLASLKPQVVIDGDRAVLKTGLEPERRVTVKIDAKQKPQQIDFIDDKQCVESGIFHFKAGLLTVCVAGNGEERPRQFATDNKSKRWLLVLKRED